MIRACNQSILALKFQQISTKFCRLCWGFFATVNRFLMLIAITSTLSIHKQICVQLLALKLCPINQFISLQISLCLDCIIAKLPATAAALRKHWTIRIENRKHNSLVKNFSFSLRSFTSFLLLHFLSIIVGRKAYYLILRYNSSLLNFIVFTSFSLLYWAFRAVPIVNDDSN